MIRLHSRLASLIVVAAIAAGCGRTEEKKVSTQVAAKVNADEVTVHQINNVLAKTAGITPDLAERAKREILDRLIDQQLARQKAIEKKLDVTPVVVQAIEAAKGEILARAYLEQVAGSLPKPSPAEGKKYYADHPELFAQRRVFNLEEITLDAKSELAAELRARVTKARSMQEIAEWLQSQGVNFVPNRGVRAAEQLPLEVLPKLQGVSDGDIQLFAADGGRYQVIRVVASRPDPVDEVTAAPRIQQFLVNQRAREAIAGEMSRIRKQAKIEYVGEFAVGAGEAKANAGAQSQTGAVADPSKAEQQLQESNKKGIAGFR